MMTLKWIAQSGEEFVHPTTHVNYVPARAKGRTATVSATIGDSLWRYDADGRAHEICDGIVYVMNETGATVAKYNIDEANLIGQLPIGYAPTSPDLRAI